MNDIFRLILAVIVLLCGCAPSEETTPDIPVFTYEQIRIEMNAEAQPILDALGEPVSYTEQPSCAFEGMDKTYCFGGFYLSTYPLDGVDYVYSLWFADDTVSTQEGLRIGDSAGRVEELYEAADYNGSNAYLLSAEEAEMMILIDNDRVSSIVYEAQIP